MEFHTPALNAAWITRIDDEVRRFEWVRYKRDPKGLGGVTTPQSGDVDLAARTEAELAHATARLGALAFC